MRQGEGEIGTLAQPAGDFDATSVRFDNAFCHEQAKTSTAVMARQRVLDLEKLLEDSPVVSGVYANPRVLHCKAEAAIARPQDTNINYPTITGKFHCVFDQRLTCTTQICTVSTQNFCARTLALTGQCNLAIACRLFKRRKQPGHELSN